MTENQIQPTEQNGIYVYWQDAQLPVDQQPAAVYHMGLSKGNE